MNKVTILLVMLAVQLCTNAQTTFYDLGTIQKIEVYFSEPNWDYRMDTAKLGSEGYTMAQWVKVNGVQFDSVGVKYKGNSSYDSTYAKNPLHIELDHYRNQSYQGIKDIKLGNGYADPSHIREVMAYNILQNYMDCPRSNFAQVYINGTYVGIYSNAESINKNFCSEHFASSANTLIKCNPIVNPGPNTKSNLKYINADSSSYFNFYEVKSTYGWNDLVNLCDTLTNYSSTAHNIIDMDRAIWMMAFNTVLVNLDSYTGVFAQNYYMYRDNTGRYNPIVWDLNMSFGGFPFVGNSNSSMGSLTVANMQQLPANFHSADPYWPLINAVMGNATYKRMFYAHARTILDEIFASGNYTTLANQLQTQVDTAVQSDANAFFSYSQFQNAMNGNVAFSSYTIPGIATLMEARKTYLQSTAEFTATQPSVANITFSNNQPSLNETVTVTIQVTNASAGVYFGYRNLLNDKFVRIQMFDDGAHNDGTAGDGIYGVSFVMSANAMQYYFYAENNNAGVFSPARAEHEYYTLQSGIPTAQPGQVVINELMAANSSTQLNEYAQYEDWIELYNLTSTPLSLYGLYLSDSYSNPTKYALPQHAVIPANGFLIVWADEETATTSVLHANFKLSSSGEQLMLSNTAGAVLDSVSFAEQLEDHSYARCPDGTGPFADLFPSRYNELNCSTGFVEDTERLLGIYPNPAQNQLCIVAEGIASEPYSYTISSAIGEVVQQGTLVSRVSNISLTGIAAGIYSLRLSNGAQQKLIIHP